MEIAPSQTLYINNINEKVPKAELRRSLYSLFSQFGPILDVVALKTIKMRGQAFVVFRDIGSATNAVRGMQGFVFYGKPMRINYARGKSFAVMKEDGSFSKLTAQKKIEEAKLKAAEAAAPLPSATLPAGDAGVPNVILYVSNITEDVTEATLQMLFNQFPGLKEVRLVPTRRDIAFVEYETIDKAAVAQSGLNGFRASPQAQLVVTFAAK